MKHAVLISFAIAFMAAPFFMNLTISDNNIIYPQKPDPRDGADLEMQLEEARSEILKHFKRLSEGGVPDIDSILTGKFSAGCDHFIDEEGLVWESFEEYEKGQGGAK